MVTKFNNIVGRKTSILFQNARVRKEDVLGVYLASTFVLAAFEKALGQVIKDSGAAEFRNSERI